MAGASRAYARMEDTHESPRVATARRHSADAAGGPAAGRPDPVRDRDRAPGARAPAVGRVRVAPGDGRGRAHLGAVRRDVVLGRCGGRLPRRRGEAAGAARRGPAASAARRAGIAARMDLVPWVGPRWGHRAVGERRSRRLVSRARLGDRALASLPASVVESQLPRGGRAGAGPRNRALRAAGPHARATGADGEPLHAQPGDLRPAGDVSPAAGGQRSGCVRPVRRSGCGPAEPARPPARHRPRAPPRNR